MVLRNVNTVGLLISLSVIAILVCAYSIIFMEIDVERILSNHSSEIKIRRLPNYIIVGVRKCGTRALIEYLNMHPNIVAAKNEINFFGDPERYKKLGLDGYRQLMPESYADQFTIEKSPSYYNTPDTAERIYAMSKNTRIIILVREPVTRIISDYLQTKRYKLSINVTYGTFNSVITTYNESINDSSKLVWKSRYIDFIDEWINTFSLNQIHVVDGERLITDPYSEMVLVEEFLSLNKYFTRDHFMYDDQKGFYCFKLDNISKSNCLGNSKGVPHPPIDKRIKNMFTKYYIPYNKAFFKKVNRTFNWNMALKNINTK